MSTEAITEDIAEVVNVPFELYLSNDIYGHGVHISYCNFCNGWIYNDKSIWKMTGYIHTYGCN